MSLGAYPDDACYDPQRPSWLPYWLDDFAESDCKFGASNIAGATVNAFASPGTVAENVGGVVGQGAGAALSDIASGIQAGITGATNTMGLGDWILLAAVGLGAVLVLKKV